jgi:signal transduction histidine kinase
MKIGSVKSINLCKSVIQTILSYDIVKAHGGELKVEAKVGEGSAFIIYLPL